MQNIILKRDYNNALTSDLTNTDTGEISIPLTESPDSSMGWLVIEPRTENEEVIFYHRSVGNTVYTYGINRDSPVFHASGSQVITSNGIDFINYVIGQSYEQLYIYKKSVQDCIIKGGKFFTTQGNIVIPDLDTSLNLPNKTLSVNAVNYVYIVGSDFLITTTQSNEYYEVAKIITALSGDIISIEKSNTLGIGQQGDKGEPGSDAPNIEIEYSIDGSSGWHDTFDVADKYIRTSSDGGVTWTSGMKFIGDKGDPGEDAPLSQFQYSVNGSTGWHGTYADGDMYIRISVDGGAIWSTSMKFIGDDGTNGTNAPATQFQYSINGSTLWHSTYTSGDKYIRSSVDGGSTWSTGAKFIGDDGTGTGNVNGPGSSTDNAIVRFDSTTGKLIQNSSATIDDDGNMAVQGIELGTSLGGGSAIDATIRMMSIGWNRLVYDSGTIKFFKSIADHIASSPIFEIVGNAMRMYGTATFDGNITANNLSGTNTGDNSPNTNSGLAHTTGDESIDGNKNFIKTLAVGKVTSNKPTGDRAIDVQIWSKNSADNGGVHFSLISDADGAAIGNKAFGIWGYPHKTSDGTIGGYERFIKCSFPTYDGNTTYTKLIELDAPVTLYHDIIHSYGKGILTGEGGAARPSLKTDWAVSGTGGGDSTRITPAGTVVTDNFIYAGSVRNGSNGDFYVSGNSIIDGYLQLNTEHNNGIKLVNGANTGHIFNDGNLHIESEGPLWINQNTNNPVMIGGGTGSLRIDIASKGAGKVLTSDASGIATWQTLSIESMGVVQARSLL